MSQEELLKRALRLARHPLLWVLALFAGETFGGGSFSNSSVTLPRGGSTGASSVDGSHQALEVVAWVVTHLGWIALAMVVVMVLSAVVSSLATGALYHAQVALDAGAPLAAGALASLALESFWRVLVLRLLILGAFLLPVLLLAALTALMTAAGGSNALLVALLIDASFGIFIALFALLLWPVASFAGRAVVLSGLRPVAALRSSLVGAARKPARVAITAGIAIALGIAVGVVFSMVDSVASLPFAGALADSIVSLDPSRIWAAALPLLLVVGGISIALGAVVGAFYSSYWTLSYVALSAELASSPPTARL